MLLKRCLVLLLCVSVFYVVTAEDVVKAKVETPVKKETPVEKEVTPQVKDESPKEEEVKDEVKEDETPVKDEKDDVAPLITKFCPAPTGLPAGPCRFACKVDSDCRRQQMCCATRCGGTNCVAPVSTQPVVAEEDTNVSTKEGECPGPYYTKDECGTLNFATCVRDSQCLGAQKCCHNGCVMTCRRPNAVKTGECPSSGTTVACNRKACVADSDCTGTFKCCNDGCRCLAPNSRGSGPLTAALGNFQQRINATLGAAAAALPSLPSVG